jgi:hypothetical protein
MSAALEARAELLMLSRLLGVDPAELDYLAELAPEALRDLRMGATDALFDSDARMLKRLAISAGALPGPLVAKIGEKVFGPLLCARVAGYLDPQKGTALAGRLSPEFLADVAIEIDPRRASRIISSIPPEQSAEVARVLTARDEFVTMGRFVAHLGPEAIAACIEVIPDDKLLPIAFVMEDKERLEGVVSMISDARTERILRDAARAGHWAEALDLLEHVSDRTALRVAGIIADQDDEVLTSLIEAAHAQELWPTLLPISAAMAPDSRRRFARLPAMQRPEVLAANVRAATADAALWGELFPLVELLTAEAQQIVAREVAALDTGELAAIISAASERGLWPELIASGARLEPGTQSVIATLIAEVDEELLAGLLAAVDEADLWDEAVAIASTMPPERLDRLLAQARAVELGDRLAALERPAGA